MCMASVHERRCDCITDTCLSGIGKVLSSDCMRVRSIYGTRCNPPWTKQTLDHNALHPCNGATSSYKIAFWNLIIRSRTFGALKSNSAQAKLNFSSNSTRCGQRTSQAIPPTVPIADVRARRNHHDWIPDAALFYHLLKRRCQPRMALLQTLMESRSIGWSFAFQLIASVLFVFVAYKFAILLVKRRASQRHFELFPGPPAHWLFGHVREVFCMQISDSSLCVRRWWALPCSPWGAIHSFLIGCPCAKNFRWWLIVLSV